MENWVEWLRQAAPGTELRIQEPMSRHTTFQVGGPAAVWAEPGSAEELVELAALCRREKIPYSVVGRGSNLLVGDKGYPGVVLHLGERLSRCCAEGTQVWAEAGISLAALARYACQAGLAGLGLCRRHSGQPGRRGVYECRGLRTGDEGCADGGAGPGPGRAGSAGFRRIRWSWDTGPAPPRPVGT